MKNPEHTPPATLCMSAGGNGTQQQKQVLTNNKKE